MTKQLLDENGNTMAVSSKTATHQHIALNDNNIHGFNLGSAASFGSYFSLVANDDIYFALTDSQSAPTWTTPSGQMNDADWTLLFTNDVHQEMFEGQKYLHYRRADSSAVSIVCKVYK